MGKRLFMSSESRSETAAQQLERNREIRNKLTLIFASLSTLTIAFYKIALPAFRENYHDLNPMQQYFVRNLFDYIGNSFNAYQFILPLIPLDFVLATAQYFSRDQRKELFDLIQTTRKITPILIAAFFVICNIDVETTQILPWSDGTPQTADIIAGFVVMISGILNLEFFQRIVNENIFLPGALVHISERIKSELQTGDEKREVDNSPNQHSNKDIHEIVTV
jgi:hypothetical protein